MFELVSKESQFMFSHPELGSDPPIGSDRESGCDILISIGFRGLTGCQWDPRDRGVIAWF